MALAKALIVDDQSFASLVIFYRLMLTTPPCRRRSPFLVLPNLAANIYVSFLPRSQRDDSILKRSAFSVMLPNKYLGRGSTHNSA